MTLRDYREKAREMLIGKWVLAAFVYFLGMLFGSALAGTYVTHPEMISIKLILTYAPEYMEYLPDVLNSIIAFHITFFSIMFTAQLMVGGVVDLGVARFTLNLHDGHPVRVKTLISQVNNFSTACVLFYYRKIRIILWSLLLIVPGIIAHYRYAMAQFILCDYPDMNAHQAIEESKELMKGHKMELFKLELSFAPWCLLCIATLGIGFIFLKPYINSAKVAFYRELSPMEMMDE